MAEVPRLQEQIAAAFLARPLRRALRTALRERLARRPRPLFEPPLPQRGAFLGRQIAEPVTQFAPLFRRQLPKLAIRSYEPLPLLRRECTKLLIALARGRALLVGHVAPEIEAIARLASVATIHFEPGLCPARDVL